MRSAVFRPHPTSDVFDKARRALWGAVRRRAAVVSGLPRHNCPRPRRVPYKCPICTTSFLWAVPGRTRLRLGVLTSHINTEYAEHEYAEHGPDGHFDGPHLALSAWGTRDFRVFRHGEEIEYSSVRPGGSWTGCTYKYVACAPDDPRLLALIAQVAPVDVRSASTAPSPVLATLSRRNNRGFAGSFRPPQALATAVASEVHTHTARCRRARVCSFDIPLGLAGRGSRGQPATARGGARPPAGTKYGGMSAWVAERGDQRPVLLIGTHGIL